MAADVNDTFSNLLSLSFTSRAYVNGEDWLCLTLG
jgi:hypothetical protein